MSIGRSRAKARSVRLIFTSDWNDLSRLATLASPDKHDSRYHAGAQQLKEYVVPELPWAYTIVSNNRPVSTEINSLKGLNENYRNRNPGISSAPKEIKLRESAYLTALGPKQNRKAIIRSSSRYRSKSIIDTRLRCLGALRNVCKGPQKVCLEGIRNPFGLPIFLYGIHEEYGRMFIGLVVRKLWIWRYICVI